MSNSWRPSPLLLAGLAASGLVAYAVYFDYKRRNDAEFRRKLRKEKKRVDKSAAQSKQAEQAEAEAASKISPEALREALEQIRQEEPPKTAEERETYFMSQVGMGEQIALQGPEFYLPAALCFYRALRMYPAPVELIMIYQRTVPPPIFNIIMEMTQLDTQARAEGYYDHFPPKSMNVSVKPTTPVDSDGKRVVHKVVIAEKDFAKGEIIYKENAVVTALDADLVGKDAYCTHCLRQLPPGTSLAGPYDSSFCSIECQHNAAVQYNDLLFSLADPLPETLLRTQTNLPPKELRQAAQEKFVEHLRELGKATPLLVAKFIGRQFAVETAKLAPGEGLDGAAMADLPDVKEYNLNDHMERYRYLEVIPPENQGALLSEVLKTALPELEQFSIDERHVTLLGKMLYNSYGVYYGSGRDDKPEPKERPEDVEKSRTPVGTARQVGSGFYLVSSYLTHSCEPTAEATFPEGNAELHLVALQDIKKGDTLTVAFVDVSSHEGESTTECRRRRRMELARGWRFACNCARCVRELEAGEPDAAPVVTESESKVEDFVERFEKEEVAEETV